METVEIRKQTINSNGTENTTKLTVEKIQDNRKIKKESHETAEKPRR